MFCKMLIFYVYQFELIILVTCIVAFVKCIENSSNKQNEVLFKQLFKLRRAEQLDAVKRMRNLQEDKQHKMVQTITKTVFDVISKSRVVLENSGYVPGVSEFPEEEAVKDALSLILENTALMGDIILRLPEVAEPVLHSSTKWPDLFAWSLSFADQTQLLDNSTATLVYLVRQELNLTTRNPDFVNPYRQIKVQQETKPEQQKEQVKKKKKTTDIPRGPRLTLRQSGEL